MKVTSLQNGDCSFSLSLSLFPRLYCTERRWPEETNSTHFWTAVSSNSPPGSVATRAKIDACSWQIARTAIYMGGDAAWQCEGKSHLAEQFPHTACSFRFILPEEIISREIALASTYSVSAPIRSRGSTMISEARREALPLRVNIYLAVINSVWGKKKHSQCQISSSWP